MCGCNTTHPTVVYVDLSQVLARLDTIGTLLEEFMATANEQLVELKAAVADTKADVLAKLAQLAIQLETLTAQLGQLDPAAQATLDEIKASVQELDAAVGDADGSDTPVPVP